MCCQNDEDVFLICMCCEDLQRVLNLHVVRLRAFLNLHVCEDLQRCFLIACVCEDLQPFLNLHVL